MKHTKIILILITIFLWQNLTGQKSDKLITITGKVMTSDKFPVEGAVIYVDNVKTSYTTNSKGVYKLKVSPSAINLEVRSEQYGSTEVAINNQKNIDFTLGSFSASGKSDVRDDSVKMPVKRKAKKMNTYANIYQMIRAEVTGVRVNGNTVQIQQGHSFFGDSTPLFVVNGVIVNSIDDVNPVEVKSIKVLKGSAASIYGLKGSNGVLSITLYDGSEKEK